MGNSMKSKRPIVLGIIFAVVLAIIIFIIYVINDHNKREEMWSFREHLDKTFFLVRDEVYSCVYDTPPDKKLKCNDADLKSRIKDINSTIPGYELKYDDTKKLKNKVIEGATIIQGILEVDIEDTGITDDNIVEVTEKIFGGKDLLIKNNDEIIEILNKYYN